MPMLNKFRPHKSNLSLSLPLSLPLHVQQICPSPVWIAAHDGVDVLETPIDFHLSLDPVILKGNGVRSTFLIE